MKCTRNVTDHVIWVGANDRRLNLFENLFPIPRGVSYNAYLIKDEKNALMDTVDASASEQFIENVAYALNGGKLDYLVDSIWNRIIVPISREFWSYIQRQK